MIDAIKNDSDGAIAVLHTMVAELRVAVVVVALVAVPVQEPVLAAAAVLLVVVVVVVWSVGW